MSYVIYRSILPALLRQTLDTPHLDGRRVWRFLRKENLCATGTNAQPVVNLPHVFVWKSPHTVIWVPRVPCHISGWRPGDVIVKTIKCINSFPDTQFHTGRAA
jgi:hypothetical protein